MIRVRVTLTDGSESAPINALNWTDAARSARIWHSTISQSADYTEFTNPVQIQRIESLTIDED